MAWLQFALMMTEYQLDLPDKYPNSASLLSLGSASFECYNTRDHVQK